MSARKGRYRLVLGPSAIKGVPADYERCRLVITHEGGKAYGAADAAVQGGEAQVSSLAFSCRVYSGKHVNVTLFGRRTGAAPVPNVGLLRHLSGTSLRGYERISTCRLPLMPLAAAARERGAPAVLSFAVPWPAGAGLAQDIDATATLLSRRGARAAMPAAPAAAGAAAAAAAAEPEVSKASFSTATSAATGQQELIAAAARAAAAPSVKGGAHLEAAAPLASATSAGHGRLAARGASAAPGPPGEPNPGPLPGAAEEEADITHPPAATARDALSSPFAAPQEPAATGPAPHVAHKAASAPALLPSIVVHTGGASATASASTSPSAAPPLSNTATHGSAASHLAPSPSSEWVHIVARTLTGEGGSQGSGLGAEEEDRLAPQSPGAAAPQQADGCAAGADAGADRRQDGASRRPGVAMTEGEALSGGGTDGGERAPPAAAAAALLPSAGTSGGALVPPKAAGAGAGASPGMAPGASDVIPWPGCDVGGTASDEDQKPGFTPLPKSPPRPLPSTGIVAAGADLPGGPSPPLASSGRRDKSESRSMTLDGAGARADQRLSEIAAEYNTSLARGHDGGAAASPAKSPLVEQPLAAAGAPVVPRRAAQGGETAPTATAQHAPRGTRQRPQPDAAPFAHDSAAAAAPKLGPADRQARALVPATLQALEAQGADGASPPISDGGGPLTPHPTPVAGAAARPLPLADARFARVGGPSPPCTLWPPLPAGSGPAGAAARADSWLSEIEAASSDDGGALDTAAPAVAPPALPAGGAPTEARASSAEAAAAGARGCPAARPATPLLHASGGRQAGATLQVLAAVAQSLALAPLAAAQAAAVAVGATAGWAGGGGASVGRRAATVAGADGSQGCAVKEAIEELAAAPIRAPAPPRVGLVTAAPPGSHAAAPLREAGWRGAAFLSAASRAGGALAGAALAPARAAGAAVGAAASGWGLGLGHAAAAAVPVGTRMATPQEQRQESSSQKATGGEAGAGKGPRGAMGFTADMLVPGTDKDVAPEQALGPAGRGSFVAAPPTRPRRPDGVAAGAAGAREAAIARHRPSASAAAMRAAAAAARALAAPLVWWVALQVSVLQSGVRTAGWLISAAVWWALLPARAALWAAAAPTRLAWHALGEGKPQGRPARAG